MITLTLNQVCIGKRNVKCRRVPHNQSNQRMHWAMKKQWTDVWVEEVGYAVMENRRKLGKLPIKFARITIYLRVVRLMDYDGAYNAVKPVLDGLRYAGVIEDDSPKHIELNVKQVKVSHRDEEKVIIEIKN